ncbi:hypothetical protein QBC36DRAFT_39706 [Triangularia setosa]|uniref:Uncharacterized protein n=1 Tax=Triangularia setosa TaxID=2587417 RepID=A0AAN7AC10_9PEZI|nr:hypothetical protein QBC36DRAFT_39706 [Podospora setosa]
MGVNMSTLVGWAVIISAAVGYKLYLDNKNRPAVRQVARQLHVTEKPSGQNRKEPKEKAKRQRVEAYSKDTEETGKNTQLKPRATKPSATSSKPANDSSDDEVDNREFARQLASIKQGTNLNATKKADEKRQKSVKQSRAQAIDEKPKESKVSAPSSTAGVDADDDASSAASPEVKPADAGDVSDMLEPKASGPSVLRLTDTEKVKPKEKKAKEPEKTETKKQRQNRRKKELEQEQRQEDERQRKVAEEAQRRQARIAEGRAAKDGSEFTNKAIKESVWAAGNSTKTETKPTNGQIAPVQPLDTFDTDSYTDVSIPQQTDSASKVATAKQASAPSNWIASLPSEEEQMKMIEDEEAWNTVPSKKSKKKKTEATSATESAGESEPVTAKAQSAPKPRAVNGAAPIRPAKIISQQSSFAALTPNDDETSKEWDV